ncbi:hypothetical protein HK101_007839, partial [Irineochytrium annulatum]
MHERGGRFTRVPDGDRCHLWNEDAYVFLCVYKREGMEDDEDEEVDDAASDGSDDASSSRTSISAASARRSRSTRLSREISTHDLHTAGSRASLASSQRSSVATTTASRRSGPAGASYGKVECVVYFWEGRRASRVAFSSFRFHALVEMEALVQSLYG